MRVENEEKSRERGFSLSSMPLAQPKPANHGDKFNLGSVFAAKSLSRSKEQTNNPSIIGDFKIDPGTELGRINQDPSKLQSWVKSDHNGIFMAFAPKVFKEIAAKEDLTKNFSFELDVKVKNLICEEDQDIEDSKENSSSVKVCKTKSSIKATNQLLADQEQQKFLIDKIKTKLNLYQLIQAQTNGTLLEIDEPIKDITKKIQRLDTIQLKALEQSFDYLTDPGNFRNKFEIQFSPTALPLLPLGVQVMHLVFGAIGAYLVGKAASETVEKIKDYKKTKVTSKTQDHLAMKIHQDTVAAKEEMITRAKELIDLNKNPDLCDSLKSKSVQLQAQYFTDMGYEIFEVVKKLHPGAYYTKYPATGDGLAIHTSTKIYGEIVTYFCAIYGWEFEKTLKDGKEPKKKTDFIGSSRNDMVYISEQQEKTIFDIKTGNATLSIEEAQKRHNNLFTTEDQKNNLQSSMHNIYEVISLGGHPKPVIIKGQVVPPKPRF